MAKHMEVDVISREVIKPSSPVLQTFKLSLLDQITPTTYVPIILFYPMNDFLSKNTQTSDNLKLSLSKTLTQFYPFSGRTKDNFIVHNFNKGVPFVETRISNNLVDFLQHPHMEKMNQFLPCQPYCYQPDPDSIPQLAVQLNTFNCGGIALGLCFSHKIIDGSTMSAFLKSWAAMMRQSCSKSLHPNLLEGSLRFVPQEFSSRTFSSLMEKMWFNKGKYVTNRFVFDAKAIESLKAMSKSENVKNPTRNEVLSAFIWKHAMIATKSMTTTLGCDNDQQWLSLSAQAVNIRRRTKPHLSDNSIGNLFWWAPAIHEYSTETHMELQELVQKLREAVNEVNSDYLGTLEGENGMLGLSEFQSLLEEVKLDDHPDIYAFTNWTTFGFNEIDFGWEKPIWVGILGGVGPANRNFIIFKESGSNNEMEAWVTLREKQMEILKKDPKFLSFASLNPSISISSC